MCATAVSARCGSAIPTRSPSPHSERGERVREPVRVVGELAEADAAGDLAAVGDEDRDGVARLPLADVDADVDRVGHAPAEAGVQLARSSGPQPLEQRQVDLRRADELRDAHRLDVRVRAGADGPW